MGELVGGGGFEGLEAAEVFEQCGPFFGADAWNVFEAGLDRRFAPELAVVGDGKAVGFVSDPLQKEQGAAVFP